MLCLAMGLSIATTSCDDMLSPESERHSYEVASDTLYSYWGILKSLQNLGERYVILGECRGDLIDGDEFTADSIKAILTFGLNGDIENIEDGANRYLKVSDYYHVINSCNAYLHYVDTVKIRYDNKRYMIREYAQVEAIRAWTYMQLVNNYGDVPFYLTPLTSTSDIQNFDLTSAKNRVNARNLWDKLNEGGRLEHAYAIEELEGYPDYASYGQEVEICHSYRLMFPMALICADLLLMKAQSQSDYATAAYYYYEFLDDDEFGGPLPLDYYSAAFLKLGKSAPDVTNNGFPWNEKDKPGKGSESITAIASSASPLWGTVQTGVNNLYGFNTVLSMVDGKAVISLSNNWERQLGPSQGYDDLCRKQKYEMYYIGDMEDIENDELLVLDNVGDARGSTGPGSQYIARHEERNYFVNEVKTKRYIMKQNPKLEYSNVFPVVYRKSMVWLRFAEAINRAGFPGYAFAILKNGLTENDDWLPSNNDADYASKVRLSVTYTGNELDANGKVVRGDDGKIKKITLVFPDDSWTEEDKKACVVTMPGYDKEKSDAEFEAFMALLETYSAQYFKNIGKTVENDWKPTTTTTTFLDKTKVVEYAKYLPQNTNIVCDYISRHEVAKAEGIPWLQFNNTQFRGSVDLPIQYVNTPPRDWTTNTGYGTEKYPINHDGENYVTRGIHQKGCGLLKYNEKRSVYNFVDQINLKLWEKKYPERVAAGEEWYDEKEEDKKYIMSKDDIYKNVENVEIIEAIEELILDEAALELAFEGNRFADLIRVANRHSDPAQYMINKIKARGKDAETWAQNLTLDNLYLPLPKALPEIVTPNN